MDKTLILGLGNTMLTDDGVGIRVVRALKARTLPPGVISAVAAVGGLRLLEMIAGYERLILVDAVLTPGKRPGEIALLKAGDLPASLHAGSAHDLSFAAALALGRELGIQIPEDRQIHIVAIRVADVKTLSEHMTPAVEASVPEAVEAVRGVLRNNDAGNRIISGKRQIEKGHLT